MTDDIEVERIAEGVARGIRKAQDDEWRLQAVASQIPPREEWFGFFITIVVIGILFWWVL